jgi:CheY-like chemotaxis protein
MFESLGCEVSKAFNGFEAAQMAKDHNYDVILMDLEMPLCNGFQASLKIKELPNQYIVALTSN